MLVGNLTLLPPRRGLSEGSAPPWSVQALRHAHSVEASSGIRPLRIAEVQ